MKSKIILLSAVTLLSFTAELHAQKDSLASTDTALTAL